MALEVIDRGQKHTTYRDSAWAPGRHVTVLTLHDQHFESGDGVYNKPVVESLALDGKDGYARACDQMRHALRYAESGGRLWTPRRNLPKESILIGAPDLLTSLGAKAEAYNLSALSLTTKRQALEWDVSGVRVVEDHNWHKLKTTLIIDKDSPTRFRWPVTLNGGLRWVDWDILAGDTIVARMLAPWATDATGRRLPVTTTLGEGYVEYGVDTRGAVFPVTVDPTFTDGPGGDVETAKDNGISSGLPNTNFGTSASIAIGASGGERGLYQFDLSSISGTCDSATFYLTQQQNFSANTISIYSILVANDGWPEGTHDFADAGAGDSCWNYKDAGGPTGWGGSAGLSTAGTDYDSTPIGSMSIPSEADTYKQYSAALDASVVESWFGASNSNYGILCVGSHAAYPLYPTSDHGTSGYRPTLTVNYTAGGGTAIKQSVNDILQLAESAGRALALRRFSASSLQVSESIKRAMALSRGTADTVNITEIAGKATALRRLVTEVVNVVEASRAARGLRRAVADTLNIVEARMAQKGLTRSVADVINIAETTGSGIATSIVKAINEALQLAESSLRALALSRPVAETVQVLEAVIRPARWLRLVAETVNIAEATKAARALRRFASEIVQIIEATGRKLTQPGVITAIVKNIAETLQLIEARSIAKWPTGRLGIDIKRSYAIIRAVGRLYAAVVQGRQYRARHEK